MGTKLSDMMRHLPKARRDRIAARAQEIRQEIKGLQSLRKAAVKTQAEIAKTLGVSQPSVAKIERQADMYLSTLRSYVEATGGKLELVIRLKDGHSVELSSLADMPQPTARTIARTATKPSSRSRSQARTA
jgi:DNA-binding XRE family transcriptional regulator